MPDETDAILAADPFWSALKRRHPDIDIVLLPSAPPAPSASGTAPMAAEPFAREHLMDTDRVWDALVGHGTQRRTARWIPGPTRDSVRRTATLTLDGVDQTVAVAHLRAAEEVLRAEGWRTFAPPTGMPRITAERDGSLGDEHLLFGYSVEARRVFLRVTSAGTPVGIARVHELIGPAA